MLCLNVGCGTCLFREPWVNADILEDIGADVVMDINNRWPWADDTFDQVWTENVLEHGWDKVHMIKELWRVCKPGAFAQITVPIFSYPGLWDDPSHKSCWSPKTLECWIQGHPAHTGRISGQPFRKIEFVLKSFDFNFDRELVWGLEIVKPGIPPRAEPPIPIPTLEEMKCSA